MIFIQCAGSIHLLVQFWVGIKDEKWFQKRLWKAIKIVLGSASSPQLKNAGVTIGESSRGASVTDVLKEIQEGGS